MKRKKKGGCPGESQHGACGVWLDASALKKRKGQTLTPLRILNRQSPYLPPTRSPLPCTKQTTISTFFRARQTGERRTSPSSKLPAQDLCFSPSAPAQSDPRWEGAVKARGAPAEDQDPLSLDCTQPLQDEGLLEHTAAAVSPLRERTTAQGSSWHSRNWPQFPPAAVRAERRHRLLSCSRDGGLMEAAGSENIDPQLQGGRELPASLFSQDSQGHKVISHRFVQERGKLPLQENPLGSQSHSSTGLFDSSQLCYDSLFTEDSEGNRVIRH